MADDAGLDAEDIARRGQEVRMRIRARLDALRVEVAEGPVLPATLPSGATIDPALAAAVRRANQALVHEIGRAAEEVLVLAEQEASRLIGQATAASQP
jgi:cell division septum initiation protein DivIVA